VAPRTGSGPSGCGASSASRIASSLGVYFSNNWWDGEIRFPRGDVERVADMGRVPPVRLMARSVWNTGRPDPIFSMQTIADGTWDGPIRGWCADAASAMAELGTPLLAEFGTESTATGSLERALERRRQDDGLR
jgi:hypothetical protein